MKTLKKKSLKTIKLLILAGLFRAYLTTVAQLPILFVMIETENGLAYSLASQTPSWCVAGVRWSLWRLGISGMPLLATFLYPFSDSGWWVNLWLIRWAPVFPHCLASLNMVQLLGVQRCTKITVWCVFGTQQVNRSIRRRTSVLAGCQKRVYSQKYSHLLNMSPSNFSLFY